MDSLEQLRDLFDRGRFGLVLIGMPGLERRLARYAPLYSRLGFVHELHPLSTAEVRRLLQEHWTPAGAALLKEPSFQSISLRLAILYIPGASNARAVPALFDNNELFGPTR